MQAFSALLLDTYRQLNSQKLFWITLILSGVIVAGFAAIGINENGVTLLWFQIGSFGGALTSDLISPATLYKQMFVNFGVGFWLGWLATILALVSTAGMIPSFIAGGAIELTLSKPISRVKLFLYKFLMGLLFTALQVGVFSVACFLLIGIRGGDWQPKVFLAIPLVVLFYSYLFSICALLGLVTRSTMAALLLTLLCWLGLFSLNAADAVMLQLKHVSIMQSETLPKRIEVQEREATRGYTVLWYQEQGLTKEQAEAEGKTPPPPTRERLREINGRLLKLDADLSEAQDDIKKWTMWSRAVFAVKTVFPKTSETTELLSRTLRKDLSGFGGDADVDAGEAPVELRNLSPREQRELQRRITEEIDSRSLWWVLGTSILSEALILAICCIIFARRDF
ncbi:MAG: ABC transporter permease [Phycisphaerae bacterium]|jgi:ABC-type transport system involved in multi-copper enzyme maturation permease subunit